MFLGLVSTAVPLVVGGFLAGLFTYWFERRLNRLARAERRAVLLESLRRELAFVPDELPAYRPGSVHFLPPVRTVVGSQLLDGQVLDWRCDALLIEPLLEFLGVASIYNDLVEAVNAGQASQSWPEDMRRHWHGQLLGAHASLLATRRTLRERLSGSAAPPTPAPEAGDQPFGPTPDPTAGWQVDLHHSRLGFSARHMGIVTVHGQFLRAEVRLDLNEDDPIQSTVEARLDAASIATGDERRDADLRSPHFLDVATYPFIVFSGTSVARAGPDRYRLTGDLTIRDVTRAVVLDLAASPPVDVPEGRRRGFQVTGQINRTEWGLTWNVALETGGWLVSEEVQLDLEIAAVEPSRAARKALLGQDSNPPGAGKVSTP